MVGVRNSLRMFFSIMILFSFKVLNNQLYSINPEVIKQKAKEIKKTLLFHKRAEKLLQCTSSLAIVYCFYKMMFPFTQQRMDDHRAYHSVYSFDDDVSKQENMSLSKKVLNFPFKLINNITSIPYDFFEVIKSGELFQSLGSMIGNYILISVVNFAIESSLNKVCHRHTIDWYVQTNAPYQRTISLCINQIESYEKREIDFSKNDHKLSVEYDVLVAMCNLLLQDLENIVAYMYYRVPVIKKQYKQDASTIQKLFLNYILDWRDQVYHIVFVEKNISKLKLFLNQNHNEIDRMYKMFALYEKHVHNYSVIKKLFC